MYIYLDLQLNIYITKMYGIMNIKLNLSFPQILWIINLLITDTCEFNTHTHTHTNVYINIKHFFTGDVFFIVNE
jgi:hypothetical protein